WATRSLAGNCEWISRSFTMRTKMRMVEQFTSCCIDFRAGNADLWFLLAGTFPPLFQAGDADVVVAVCKLPPNVTGRNGEGNGTFKQSLINQIQHATHMQHDE
ncbi:unnamed protein product, partial [Owenia fusiformis]